MMATPASTSKLEIKSTAITSKKSEGIERLEEMRLHFAEALQSSLDLEDTISHFYSAAQNYVRLSSLNYNNNSRSIDVRIGTARQHQVKYNLKFKNRNLGTLVATRGKPFSEQELEHFEEMVSMLYYPLRNALLYLDALDNSLRDALTKVGNRAAMELALKRELCLTKRHNKPLSLIIVDVDHFKRVNDTIGHHNGDRVLKHVASLIQDTLRQSDQIFRFGGEEFLVLLSDTTLEAGVMVAERIRMAVEFSFLKIPEHGTVQATVSLGVSGFSSDDTRESLFQRADDALYQAKNSGRNRVIDERQLDSNTDTNKNLATS